MKKTMGIMLAVALIISMMTTLSFSASGEISLSENQEFPGKEVELTLSISENPGIIATRITVLYDTENFTLKEVSDKGNLGDSNHSDDYSLSEYILSWYNPLTEEDYTYNGDLATLTFEINEGAEAGEYPICVTVNEAYDSNLRNVTLGKVDGKITVKEKLNFEGIILEDKSFVYDGLVKSLEVEGEVPEGTTINYENNEAKDVAEKTVKAILTKEDYNDLELTAQLEITPKDIYAEGIEIKDKVYDGTETAEYTGGSLSGIIAEDEVSLILADKGTFESADAGENKAVTIELSLDGRDKANYNLVMPALRGDITKKDISIESVNLDEEKVAFSGVLEVDTDKVSLDFAVLQIELGNEIEGNRSEAFLSNIMLNGEKSENYELGTETFSTSISNSKTALITVEAKAGGNVEGGKRYLIGSQVTLTAVPESGYNFARWEVNDESVSISRTYEFIATKDLEIRAVFNSIVQENKNFTGITLEDKSFVYDGQVKSLAVDGEMPEGTTINYENNEAKDVAEKTVTAVLTKEGYNDLRLEAQLEITPKDIYAEGIEIKDKVYDGTETAEYTGGSLSGIIAEDEVSLLMAGTGTFESAEAGENKAVTIELSLDGADKDNYNLIMPALRGEITQKDISIESVNLDEEKVTFSGVLEVDTDKVSLDFAVLQIELGNEIEGNRSEAFLSNILLAGEKGGNYKLVTKTFSTSISNSKTVLVTAIAKNGTVNGTGIYLPGSEVTLTATPKLGYKFDRWEVKGVSVGPSKTYVFKATEDLEITAVFKKTSSGGGGGGGGGISKPDDDKVSVGGNSSPGAPTPAVPTPVTPTPVTPAPTEQPSELTAPLVRDAKKEIVLTIGQKDTLVFGEKKTNDVSAVIKNSRTMLPIRFISEALKAEVSWDNDKREVKVVREGIEILIAIDSKFATVNGKAVELDSPAFIENSRTYLPVRFISESLGADVYWEGTTQSVIIQVK